MGDSASMLALKRATKSAHIRWDIARSRARGALLRLVYAPVWSCGPGLTAGAGVHLEVYGELRLGRDVRLSPGCSLTVGPAATLDLGDGAFVGRNTVIVAVSSIQIGARALIAEHCTIRDADHHLGADERRGETKSVSRPMTIGADVWIGAGARILRGADLGAGAVVGANAVVRHAVPAHAVVAGVPAKLIKHTIDSPRDIASE
jgi:acetyltransferase-like isoleucine patch superfamily enzyme